MSGQYVDWCGWFKQYGNIIIINPAILFFYFEHEINEYTWLIMIIISALFAVITA